MLLLFDMTHHMELNNAKTKQVLAQLMSAQVSHELRNPLGSLTYQLWTLV